MNWVKENKFLTGFIAVMVIGVGVLGFLVLSASSKLEEATTMYNAKATAFNRLRNLSPFPSRKHLDAFALQKAEAAEVINQFQADLAKKEFAVEPMTPFEFQDCLKNSVTEIRTKAAEANVKLPEKFYLGFDRYETAPPDQIAAPVLGRQLKAIEWVLQQFIATKISELKSIARPELPEEKGRAGVPAGTRGNERAADRPRQGGAGAPGSGERGGRGGTTELVSNRPFDLVVVCKQLQFANVLNLIISPTAPQFYIPRAVRVTNQSQKGPQRAVEVPAGTIDPNAPPGTPPVAAAPTGPAPSGDINYIVGEELIEVALRLEIVDFMEVSAK